MKKNETIRNAKNFDEILDMHYGKIGTKKRDGFEAKAQYFVISETQKNASPLKSDEQSTTTC